MRNKILCIIQARTGSKRFPNKILMKVFNKTLLEFLLDRIKRLKRSIKIIVATTKKKKDQKIINISKKNNVSVFCGSETNVLKRYFDIVNKKKPDTIIRITSDCPLIDISYVEELLNYFLNSDYDYVNNFDHKYLPEGFCCEIFNYITLAKTYKFAKSKFDKEHVTSYIWKHPNRFKIKYFKTKKKMNLKDLRLTLDYFEDYLLIKKIIENLYLKKKYFTLNDIINFIKKNKYLINLNKRYNSHHWMKYQKLRLRFAKKIN